ncbi:MAG TPA: thiamine pyrophosphate-dependent enzyme, partial [Mycobacteriales bacterium]|nr:thiamine pyrophosphate-dependent enzyme [Mycobacteriales bacterium]
HRLQMLRAGQEFGNEFRRRENHLEDSALSGEYLQLDLAAVAAGLGATARKAETAAEFAAALAEARDANGPFVIVVPTVPHADLPGAGVWWDVAPAEVSEQDWVRAKRAEYETDITAQRYYG